MEQINKRKMSSFLLQRFSFHYALEESLVKIDYPKRMRIQAIGVTYGPQESTFEDIYFDELTLSVALMRADQPDLAAQVDRQVRNTEEVAKYLGVFAANLARAAGESGDGAGEGARERAKQHFYARVDDPFRHWLANIDEDSKASEIAQGWERSLRAFAQETAAELVASTPSAAIIGRETGWGFMNIGTAENFFNSALNKLLPIQENTQEGTK